MVASACYADQFDGVVAIAPGFICPEQRKMLIVHGASDEVFSMQDAVNWYDLLDSAYASNAEEFTRLFLVPGMRHIAGGPATDQYDALMALVEWVEQGQAPDSITANVREGNADVESQGWPLTRSRLLCSYPSTAQYNERDVENATSFECR